MNSVDVMPSGQQIHSLTKCSGHFKSMEIQFNYFTPSNFLGVAYNRFTSMSNAYFRLYNYLRVPLSNARTNT